MLQNSLRGYLGIYSFVYLIISLHATSFLINPIWSYMLYFIFYSTLNFRVSYRRLTLELENQFHKSEKHISLTSTIGNLAIHACNKGVDRTFFFFSKV